MSRHDEVHSACLNILTDSPHSAVRIAELCTFARALGGEIDDLRAACAAGEWRTDVENCPLRVEVLMRNKNRERYVAVWQSPPVFDRERYPDAPDAWAPFNPPQVKP